MKNIGQKGEGAVKTILLLVILAGAVYAGYVYLWPMLSGPSPAPQTAAATPVPGDAKAASPAAAAVQGANALGEISSGAR